MINRENVYSVKLVLNGFNVSVIHHVGPELVSG